MNKMIMIFLLFLGMNSSVFAEPYADKVKITSNTTPLGQMMIKASKVPSRSSVNIPPYPGAVIFQAKAQGEMKMNGKDTLPYLKLLTAEDMDKVVAWYKKQLPDYSYQKQGFAGMFMHVFWEQKGEYSMLDIEARMFNVNVAISDGAIHKDDYPKARTMIEITYETK